MSKSWFFFYQNACLWVVPPFWNTGVEKHSELVGLACSFSAQVDANVVGRTQKVISGGPHGSEDAGLGMSLCLCSSWMKPLYTTNIIGIALSFSLCCSDIAQLNYDAQLQLIRP